MQAGSFRSPEQAERLRSQLAQKGYQARVQLFTAPNNESWYRVRVGNYSERSAAGQTAQNLTSQEQLQTVVANDHISPACCPGQAGRSTGLMGQQEVMAPQAQT